MAIKSIVLCRKPFQIDQIVILVQFTRFLIKFFFILSVEHVSGRIIYLDDQLINKPEMEYFH